MITVVAEHGTPAWERWDGPTLSVSSRRRDLKITPFSGASFDRLTLTLDANWIAEFPAISTNNHNGGAGGCVGFGPKARAVSRCGRLTFDIARCRAYSSSPTSLYCGLVSEARNATSSSISGSVSAKGCMSSSSHGSVIPSPLL